MRELIQISEIFCRAAAGVTFAIGAALTAQLFVLGRCELL